MKRAIKSAVAYICTASIRNIGVMNQARVAKKKLLSVPQAALNQRVSQPIVAFRVERLNERIKRVSQRRPTKWIACGDQNQPLPAKTRIATNTATSSMNQTRIWRGSAPRAGLCRVWQITNAKRWMQATAIKARDQRPLPLTMA